MTMKTIDDLTLEDVQLIQDSLVNIPDVGRCLDILGYDSYNVLWYDYIPFAEVPEEYREVVKALKAVTAIEGRARLEWCSNYAKKHKTTPIELVQAFYPQLLRINTVGQGEQSVIKLREKYNEGN